CSADNASWQSTVLYHDGEQSKPLVQALFVNRAKAGTPMATIKAQTAPAAIGFKNDYERARKMLKAGGRHQEGRTHSGIRRGRSANRDESREQRAQPGKARKDAPKKPRRDAAKGRIERIPPTQQDRKRIGIKACCERPIFGRE